MIQFAYTILYVQDVAKSIAFYENAFSFTKKVITPDGSYWEIVTETTTLSFAATTLDQLNFTKGFIASNLQHKPLKYQEGLINW